MTTHNTHHEHNDVDASVVEQQSGPENTVAPSTSETVTPEGTEIQAGTPAFDVPATPNEPQIEVSQETSTVSGASTIQVEEQQDTPEQEDQSQNASSSEATTNNETMSDDGNSTTSSDEAVTIPDSNETSLSETKEEEIRPFTDFIEEFRQAEEARLSASRQEVETEPFELLGTEGCTFYYRSRHCIRRISASYSFQ